MDLAVDEGSAMQDMTLSSPSLSCPIFMKVEFLTAEYSVKFISLFQCLRFLCVYFNMSVFDQRKIRR